MKIKNYLVIILISIALSFLIVYALKDVNKVSEYFPPAPKEIIIEDDTGYTEHSSGWPKRFYSYVTYMPFKPEDDGSGNLNCGNFLTNVAIFMIPTSLILGSTDLIISRLIKKKK